MKQQKQTRILIFLLLTGFALAMTYDREGQSDTHIDRPFNDSHYLNDSYNELLAGEQKNYEKWHAPAEPWITELIAHTKEIPYAQAQISVEASGEYNIKWQEFETKEAFLTDREYDSGSEYVLVSYPREWTFIKFQLDDTIHVLDVFRYIEENTPSSKYFLETRFSEGWRSISIDQKRVISPTDNRQTILLDNGCLYLLRCKNENRDDLGYIDRQLNLFITKNFSHYSNSHEADEESLYWFDHKSRLTTLENPDRTFFRVQASALTRTDQAAQRYGMLMEASYRIPVSFDSCLSVSELEIRFRLVEELPETGYIHGQNHSSPSVHIDCLPDLYIMEVWAMPEKKLLLQTEQALIGASKDPVQFEDINEDGFPDLSIDRYCPLHGSVNDDLYTYYWLWNPTKTCFVPVTGEDIIRQSKEDQLRGFLAAGNNITVQVRDGDTLWTLSEKYYGSGSYYKEIYLHNRERIGSDPNLLPSGIDLTLMPIN